MYSLYIILANPTMTTANDHMIPRAMILEGESLLKEGDLVVRLNRDPASWFIKQFNQQDKSYSHSGIVLVENGHPYVFHILNGEENPDEKLRKDSFAQFCNSIKNSEYAIFRYDLTSGEVNELRKIIHHWYETGVRYDNRFSLTSDDKMYCSELISKALAKASDRIVIKPTQLTLAEAEFFSGYTHLPLSYTSKLQIVSIDDLYSNTHCHLIKKYNYNDWLN
jgi:Permuted papain-like amidase enzyme, YaeF/YiiX, C92 family